jgi:hypothetical protein
MLSPKRCFDGFLIVWSVLCVYGLLCGFAPNPWVMSAGAYAAIFPAIVISAGLFYFYPKPSSGIVRKIASVVAHILLVGMFGLMSWGVLAFAIPAISNHFIGNEVTKAYEIEQISSGRWVGRGCRFAARLNGLRAGFGGKLCVSEETWTRLRAGDIVEVKGRESMLGFSVCAIR